MRRVMKLNDEDGSLAATTAALGLRGRVKRSLALVFAEAHADGWPVQFDAAMTAYVVVTSKVDRSGRLTRAVIRAAGQRR